MFGTLPPYMSLLCYANSDPLNILTSIVALYGLTLLIFKIKMLWNVSDLEFHLSWSLKVKSNSAVGLPIYGFLLMFNYNIGAPLVAPLLDIRIRNKDTKCEWPLLWPFRVTEGQM